MILKLIADKTSISRTELSQKLSLIDAQIKTAFKYLRDTNQIDCDGSARKGMNCYTERAVDKHPKI